MTLIARTYYCTDFTNNVRLMRKWDPETLILGDLIREGDGVMPYKMITNPVAVYLTTKTAAELAREVLKERFPGIRFSVRIARFAGGSSITIRWKGGPNSREVNDLLNAMTSRGFDAMTDSTTSSDHLIAWKGTIYKPCFAFINCLKED